MLRRLNIFRADYWNKGRVGTKHLTLALVLVFFTYLFYTAFRRAIPTPDVLSPFAYLLAFIACLAAYLRFDDKKSAKVDFWVLVLCGLAFMDEISYGVEPGFINAIYVEKYNVYIYDLHNLIGLVVELVQIFLRENNWNGPLFASYLTTNFSILILSIAFVAVIRIPKSKKELTERLPSILTGFLLIAGIATLLTLALLPADPKNAWLLTFSRTRILMIAGVAVMSALPLLFLQILKRKDAWAQSLRSKFAETGSALTFAKNIAIFLILLAISYQLYTPFITYPDQKVILERITPLTAWLIASSLLLFTAVQAWLGRLTKPLKSYWDPVRNFFHSNPSSIYALVAIALVIVAQVNDKEWLPIGNYFSISNIDVADWGWWTEEVFEFTAAIEFFAASFFFRKNR